MAIEQISNLLIFDENYDQLSRQTNFGGSPVFNEGTSFAWPACSCCEGNLQYLGKIDDGKYINLIFMCQNEPGMCDEWSSDEGGNKVIRFIPQKLANVTAPDSGEILRETHYGCKIEQINNPCYDEAREKWAKKSGNSIRHVLGMLGGNAQWLQGDETPVCDSCSANMSFVAQLEEGPHHNTEMNFGGGGCAYLFACDSCESAKFLWQC